MTLPLIVDWSLGHSDPDVDMALPAQQTQSWFLRFGWKKKSITLKLIAALHAGLMIKKQAHQCFMHALKQSHCPNSLMGERGIRGRH